MTAYYHGMKIQEILEYRQGNKYHWAIVIVNGVKQPIRTDYIVIENN